MRKRNNGINVYFNEEENNELCRLNKETGLSKSDIIRHLILRCKLKPTPEINYDTHIKDLREVGYKLNRILLNARTGGYMNPKEVQNACDELQTIEDNMFKEIRSVPHDN